MVSPSKATRVGGTDPLKVREVSTSAGDTYQSGDPFEIHIELNRATDDLERQVFANEFGHTGLTLRSDYLVYEGDFKAIDAAEILTFLEDFNARVMQRREEGASARERLRAQGQQLKDVLTSGN